MEVCVYTDDAARATLIIHQHALDCLPWLAWGSSAGWTFRWWGHCRWGRWRHREREARRWWSLRCRCRTPRQCPPPPARWYLPRQAATRHVNVADLSGEARGIGNENDYKTKYASDISTVYRLRGGDDKRWVEWIKGQSIPLTLRLGPLSFTFNIAPWGGDVKLKRGAISNLIHSPFSFYSHIHIV